MESERAYWTSNRTGAYRVSKEIGLRHFPLGVEHILDIGCSNGTSSAELADLNPKSKIIGIDKSREKIDEANSILLQYIDYYDDRLKFILGDGYDLRRSLWDQKVKKFGAIFVMNSLAYVTDEMPYDSLRNIFINFKDHLENKGKLFITGGSQLDLGHYDYVFYRIVFEKHGDVLVPTEKFFGYSEYEWPYGFHNKLFAAAANADFSGESFGQSSMRTFAFKTFDIDANQLLANAASPRMIILI